jgi:alkylhydroperoxidase family enzyme
MGQELNFLKQMAFSPTAFQAFLSFDEALGEGTLDTFTHESIYIGTSNYNGCVY